MAFYAGNYAEFRKFWRSGIEKKKVIRNQGGNLKYCGALADTVGIRARTRDWNSKSGTAEPEIYSALKILNKVT